MATKASDEEINISFRPTPNYAALAEAAAGTSAPSLRDGSSKDAMELDWMKGEQARTVGDLRQALIAAATRVHMQGKGMLIEAIY
jgi:hypothetical protein